MARSRPRGCRRRCSATWRASPCGDSSGPDRADTSISRDCRGDTKNVWRITADPSTEQLTDGPVRLTTGTGQETNVAVSPDEKKILFTSSTSRTRLWTFPLDSGTGRIVGEPRPITQGSTGEVDFDAQADGSKVAYRAVRAGRNELWERSLGEGRERLLLSSPDWKLVKPRWSPDGARLAFLRCGSGGGAPVLALLNADGSGERALTRPNEVEMLRVRLVQRAANRSWARVASARPIGTPPACSRCRATRARAVFASSRRIRSATCSIRGSRRISAGSRFSRTT